VVHTPTMEQNRHELELYSDVEAMLADREAAAERIRREVDEVVAAAAEKRGAYVDWKIENLRGDARVRPDASSQTTSPDGRAARLLVASARAAEDVRNASRAEALRTLTEAREASALVEAETERERAALVELRERRARAERQAEELLVETGRVEREMQERQARAERESAELLAQAQAEADRVLAAAEEERRVRVERESAELLASARAEADRIVAAAEEERRVRAERESAELLASIRKEADRIVAVTEEERGRVRKLLAGAIASLDVGTTAPGSPVEEPASRLPETMGPPAT
jgi:hypothetical protein